MGDDTDERLAVDLYIAALLKEERVESTIAAKVMIELLKKLDRLKAENEKLRAMLRRAQKAIQDEEADVHLWDEIEAELKGGK